MCQVLPGPEAFDTACCIIKFANGKEAIIDVCRQAPYGYDQRAEVLGTKAMIQTDNNYPNTAKIFSASYTGNADMPFDFFMSRYEEAYVQELIPDDPEARERAVTLQPTEPENPSGVAITGGYRHTQR